MSTAPLVFRLHPEKSGGLFVRVQVWPTRSGMCEYLGREHDVRRLRRVLGNCVGIKTTDYRHGRARTQMHVAEVNLWAGRLTMEVVTHEMFHATIAWARRLKFDFTRLNASDSVNADEERLTYAHGRLCRDFVCRATSAGLYP